VDPALAEAEYGIAMTPSPDPNTYDATILAVAHREFVELGIEGIRAFGKAGSVLFDVKGVLPRDAVDGRL
jgi:UDP-N-acetyl-D-galactosamine dehydrogenase